MTPEARSGGNFSHSAEQTAPTLPSRSTPMMTNPESRTSVHDVADGIYRISTPVTLPDGTAFSFNQYLVVDDDPLLFHTGPRHLFPLVRQAVDAVMPASRLRHVGFSHVEADECGSLNQWLAVAPQAAPLCG